MLSSLLRMHEVKSKSLSHVQLFATPWNIRSMEFSRPEYRSGLPFPSPGNLPNSGIKPRSPALQADSLPSEPQGKSKNTGVGSLSLLQQIFPTQELNWGLLHCRWSLYQLSYVGNPGTHSIQPYRFSVEFHVWTSNLRELTLCRERTQIPLK